MAPWPELTVDRGVHVNQFSEPAAAPRRDQGLAIGRLAQRSDEWQLQHRYMQVEAMAELLAQANQAEARQIASAA